MISSGRIESIRNGLEYVAMQDEYWSLIVGHTIYMDMVRNNALLLAVYVRTESISDYNIWITDCNAF